MTGIEPYGILLLQLDMPLMSSPEQRPSVIKTQMERAFAVMEKDTRHDFPPFVGCAYPVKMVVLPEFFFGNLIMSSKHNNTKDWLKIAIEMPGEETDRLAQKCVERDIYMTLCAEEYDPEWPDRFWDTSIIINNKGKIVLRYRKINCLNTIGMLTHTTVGSIYDEYVKKYGMGAVFPVADTPLGRLSTLICYDINFPEVARCMALKGAEVLLHPTSDRFPHVKAARAYENTVYLASANVAHCGLSQMVDYKGEFVIPPADRGAMPLRNDVDVEKLRQFRSKMIPSNFLTQVKSGVYAPVYEEVEGTPINCFSKPQMTLKEGTDVFEMVLKNMYKHGVFARVGSDRRGTRAKR